MKKQETKAALEMLERQRKRKAHFSSDADEEIEKIKEIEEIEEIEAPLPTEEDSIRDLVA